MSTNAIIYISACMVLLVVSFIFNRQKTFMGLKKGWNMFKNILVPFLNIIILVSIALYLIPPSIIIRYLDQILGHLEWG